MTAPPTAVAVAAITPPPLLGTDCPPAPAPAEVAEVAAPPVPLALEKEYLALSLKLKKLNGDADPIKKRMAVLEEKLLENWGLDGISQMRIDKNLLSLRDMPVASMPQGKDAAIALLKRSRKYRDMVTASVNTNSLSALLRELLAVPGSKLPPSWKGVIEDYHVYSIRVTKA